MTTRNASLFLDLLSIGYAALKMKLRHWAKEVICSDHYILFDQTQIATCLATVDKI